MGWRCPHYTTIHRIIENPIYGGAYAYGKSRVATGYDAAAGVIRPRSRRKARAEWLALIPGVHEGYVSWERSEAIRKMVSDNLPTGRHHGAPKHGDALLAGLVRCRRCGRKLTIRYTADWGVEVAAGVSEEVDERARRRVVAADAKIASERAARNVEVAVGAKRHGRGRIQTAGAERAP